MEELGAVRFQTSDPSGRWEPSPRVSSLLFCLFVSVCLSHFVFTTLCLSLPTSVSSCLSLRVSSSVLTASWSRAVGRTPRRGAHSSWAKKRGRRPRPASARGWAWGAELPVGPGMAGGFRWAQDGDWGGGRAVSAACWGRTVQVAGLEAPQAVACGAVRGGGMSQAAFP